ncbi:MAG TPA: hypothetical protein VM367_12860 [Pseudonocardia sp.]|nr:hypothetical protein [Pseudonocardia sp.]
MNGSDDLAGQRRELDELHRAGVLDEQEHALAVARLLAEAGGTAVGVPMPPAQAGETVIGSSSGAHPDGPWHPPPPGPRPPGGPWPADRRWTPPPEGQSPDTQWGRQPPDTQWPQPPDTQWPQPPDTQWGQQPREAHRPRQPGPRGARQARAPWALTAAAGGLVVLAAFLALLAVGVPAAGSFDGTPLGGPVTGTVLPVLVAIAATAVLALGAWRGLAGAGAPRAAAAAVPAAAGLLAAVYAVAIIALAAGARPDQPGTSTVLLAGYGLALLGAFVAVVGAAADLLVADRSAGTARPAVLVALPLVAVLVLAVAGAVTVRAGAAGPTVPPVPDSGPSPDDTVPDAGPPVIASVTATCVSPPSRDAGGVPVGYTPEMAVDGRADTAWRCDGSGVGQVLDLTLAGPSRIRSVGLLPGYAKIDPVDGTDRYLQNGRVAEVRYEFGGGASVTQTFDTGPDGRVVQELPVEEIVTDRLRVVVLRSVPGEQVGTQAAVDRVAVSEIVVS